MTDFDRFCNDYLANAPEKDIEAMLEGWEGKAPNAAEWEIYFRLNSQAEAEYG